MCDDVFVFRLIIIINIQLQNTLFKVASKKKKKSTTKKNICTAQVMGRPLVHWKYKKHFACTVKHDPWPLKHLRTVLQSGFFSEIKTFSTFWTNLFCLICEGFFFFFLSFILYLQNSPALSKRGPVARQVAGPAGCGTGRFLKQNQDVPLTSLQSWMATCSKHHIYLGRLIFYRFLLHSGRVLFLCWELQGFHCKCFLSSWGCKLLKNRAYLH